MLWTDENRWSCIPSMTAWELLSQDAFWAFHLAWESEMDFAHYDRLRAADMNLKHCLLGLSRYLVEGKFEGCERYSTHWASLISGGALNE